jgi:DNA-binding transcriptional LysR family regulator
MGVAAQPPQTRRREVEVELRQLRYFVALAEELHFGAAAERLRISKATLSQQISVLERNLEVELLKRDRRQVSLTPSGEALLHEARGVLNACDQLRYAVRKASHNRPALDVRVTNGIEHSLVRALVAVQDDPTLAENLSVTSGLDAEAAVAAGRADAALVWMVYAEHATLHAEQIASTPVFLAVPEAHRLATADVERLADLRHERIALFPRRVGPAMWDVFVGHLLPDGPEPGQVLEEQTTLLPMMGMLRAAAEGRGVAPFVPIVADAIAPAGVVLRPLDPPFDIPIQLVSREPHRPELRRLADLLRQDGR